MSAIKTIAIPARQGPPGPPGPPGPSGTAAAISTDPENRLTAGTDGGLKVPEYTGPDPLTAYILARNGDL